jgi:hypothetical protein
MARTASIAAIKFAEMLKADDTGLGTTLGQLSSDTGVKLAGVSLSHIIQQNTPFALAEKTATAKYPAVHVYCDRIQNLLTEKFRTFSGKVRTVAEVRVSQDRIEGLEEQVRLYAEAVTNILDASRGDWGQGMFFAGQYEVKFEPVQQGGKNFLQAAKVTFEVDLSS